VSRRRKRKDVHDGMVRYKLLTAIVILSVFTAIILMWNVALATPPNPEPAIQSPNFDITEVNPEPVIDYRAVVIGKLDAYWNLTTPDIYVHLAIVYPGHWISCRENETTFLTQVKQHSNVWKIRYGDNYYEMEALWSASPHPAESIHRLPKIIPLHLIPHTNEHVVSGLALAGLWGLLIVKRKSLM
jgi:hypothetical protein